MMSQPSRGGRAWLIARDLTRRQENGVGRAVLAFVTHLLLMIGVTRLVVRVMPPMQH
jgi:hypothetical protein